MLGSGVLALTLSATVLYSAAVVVVHELFLRWGVFETAGPGLVLLLRFAFNVPIVAVLVAAGLSVVSLVQDEPKSLRPRYWAVYGAGAYMFTMPVQVLLINQGVLSL